ncbi:MAG: hypothetical protein KGZ30_03125 [Anaplasmataceae bacterium]|nr:hypothetical protein [Anaplasmataceae bacterium]
MFQRELILNLVVVIASFILGTVGIFWLGWSLETTASNVELSHIEQAKRIGLVSSAAELRQDEITAEEYLGTFDRLIPIEDRLINLESYLRVTAERKGLVSIFNFEGGPTPPTDATPGRQPFSLTLRGEMNQLLTFLEEFERGRANFLFTVDTVSLSSFEEAHQLEIKAATYFKKTAS